MYTRTRYAGITYIFIYLSVLTVRRRAGGDLLFAPGSVFSAADAVSAAVYGPAFLVLGVATPFGVPNLFFRVTNINESKLIKKKN